jgi:diguanylate cyclase (GGDEF)-like protein/PAS domain S-box-containing protein
MSAKENLKHCLKIKYGQVEQQFVLTNDIYSIGRHSSNAIVIPSEKISRFHCTILPVKYHGQKQQQLFWIIDGDLQGNRSSNGIYINNDRCLSHELKSGDLISIGGSDVEISYLVLDVNTNAEIAYSEANFHDQVTSFESIVEEESPKSGLITTVVDENKQEDLFLHQLIVTLTDRKERVQIPSFTMNLAGEILYSNNKFQELLIIPDADKLFNLFCESLIPELKEKYLNFTVRTIEYEGIKYTQYAHLSVDKKQIECYIFSFQERLKIEQKLRENEEKYRAIVRQISEGIILVDPVTKKIVEANNAYCSLLGYSHQEITALTIHDLVATDPEINDSIIHQVQRNGLDVTQESIHRHSNNSLINVEVNISNVYFGAQKFICYAVRDVTQRKLAEEMLKYQACHDYLTELANRNLFNDRLEEAITELNDSKGNLAVIFIDIDRFKNINDTLGHDVGDLFLQQVSSRLKNCLRKEDLIARWGGDEFTILLHRINSKKDIDVLAKKILHTFKQPLRILDYQLYCHLSMGIAIYPEDGYTSEILVKNADTALYKQKEQGGNYYQYYLPSMNEQKKELLELESDLYEAIQFNQFQLYYQPQINFKTQKIVGMEALIRWQHPHLGTVSPGKFIPLAEQTGFINTIGQWALFTACKQNKRWQNMGLPPLKMSVNLSPRQCQPELVSILKYILARTQLSPEYLELEITENSIMIHPELTKNVLEDITRMGITVSMDDFGTGYSSLGYLKKFPFHTIKIDQSFVRELKDDPEDLAIISAVVTLGKGFDLQIIAEGVETIEQLNLLTNLGCDIMQGYLFSRPLPVYEATNFLKFFLNDGLNFLLTA